MPRPIHPQPEPPEIPEHELVRRIGWGSYGEVWLGRQRSTGAWHAVKLVYRESFDDDRPFEREFEGIRECEPISHGHEGVIDILQVGRDEEAGFFYYVMELADDHERGRELVPEDYQPRSLRSELLDRGRLPLVDCVEHGRTLAEGLRHLHEHGLVHRDIKPSNIVFVEGKPKLADIGLVTSMDATYSWVGTPGYIPQEGPGHKAADIFSLGKVLYEISTGKDRHDFPALPADISDMQFLNEVLLRACARLATDRHADAAELARDLDRVAQGKPPWSVERRKRRRVLAWAAVLVLGGLAWAVYERSKPNVERGVVVAGVAGEMGLGPDGPVAVEDHRGRPGGAWLFDGSDDRAELELTRVIGSDATLAVWVKSTLRESSGCIAGVFRGHNHGDSPIGIWLEARAFGKIALRQRGSGDGAHALEAGSDWLLKGDGIWHHVVGVSANGSLRLYVDGRLQNDSAQVAALESGKGTLRLGTHGEGDFFRGAIGEVRVYDRALTAVEARQLYDRSRAVDVLQGLVAHYPLDGTGADISGGNRHLRLRGTVPAMDRHGRLNGALGLDGVDDWAGITRSAAPIGEAPRTLAVWARRDANQTANRSGMVTTGYAGNRTAFGLDFIRSNSVARVRRELEAEFPAGRWVHWAVTFDGARSRLFADGKLAGEFGESLNTGQPHLFLGVNALILSDAPYFRGVLDGLRIYDRALSADEVAGLWHLEKPVVSPAPDPASTPRLLFANSDFAAGTLENWLAYANMGVPDGNRSVGSPPPDEITIESAPGAAGGHVAFAKEWADGVTLLSPKFKVAASNRILLARFCKPFSVSSCNLVVIAKEKIVRLEENHEPNLVTRRHDLRPWLGQTIRVGFSGGQMRMDFLKTLPAR